LSSNVIITTDPYWQFDSHCQVLLFMSVRVTFVPLYRVWQKNLTNFKLK